MTFKIRSFLSDKLFLALFLLAGFLFFFNLPSVSLWAPDEPREATIARNILETGDYLVPIFNGKPLPWKPLLFHWLILIPSHVAGEVNEFTARLPSVFSALFLLLSFYLFLLHFRGRSTALASCFVLLTNYLFVRQARFSTIDMTLTFLICLSSIFIYRGTVFEEKRKVSYALFYVFAALSVLAKGPVGIVLPLLIAVLFLILEGQVHLMKKLFHPLNLLLFLMIALPWYVLVCVKEGKDFAYEFLIRQNFTRFTNAFDHVQPFYFYVHEILTHFFPWSLLLPAASLYFFRFIRKQKAQNSSLSFEKFMIVWCLTVFIFYSLSKSKRIAYILPMFPPLSFFIGDTWARFFENKDFTETSLKWSTVPVFLISAIIGLLFFLFPFYLKIETIRSLYPVRFLAKIPLIFSADYFTESLFWVTAILALTLYFLHSLWIKEKTEQLKAIFLRTGLLSASLWIFMVVSLYPKLDIRQSARPHCDQIRNVVGNSILIGYNFEMSDFVYYLRRPRWDNIEYGDLAGLKNWLSKPEKVFCMISLKEYKKLGELKDIPHHVVLSNLKGWKWDALLLANH